MKKVPHKNEIYTIFLVLIPMILLGISAAYTITYAYNNLPDELLPIAKNLFTAMGIQYFVALVVLALVTTIVAIIISKTFSKPFSSIIAVMERVMSGDLTVRCNPIGAKSTVYMATMLNKMLGIIEKNYDKIEKSREEILKTAAKLKSNEERHLNILMVANDAILEWDIVKATAIVSEQWTEVIGNKPPAQFTKKTFFDLFDLSETEYTSLNNFLNDIAGEYEGELRLKKHSPDEKQKWVSFKAIGLFDDNGRTCKVFASFSNITKRVEDAEKLQYLAYYDALTGLLKYTRFMELAQKLVSDEANTDRLRAMILIDLDGFKNVNDTLGHNVGDFAIQSVAKKIDAIASEKGISCRFGGDEFVILLTDIRTVDDAHKIVEQIRKEINQPLFYNENTINFSASIGISFFPLHSTDLYKLFKYSDYAMYQAKKRGKNQFVSYTDEIGEEEMRKTNILKCLKNLTHTNELKIYYQPQISAISGQIVGFEALLRLFSAEIGFIAPAEFIPIAEENGLMYNLGLWILKKVCTDLSSFKCENDLINSITVNISPIQLSSPEFVSDIIKIFTSTGVQPSNLEFDISADYSFISNKAIKDTVARLSNLGIRVAIDDFGIGFSSLKNFKEIPADSIKIDKNLIRNISKSKKDYEIVKMVTGLAHNLNVVVIAKGIENNEQLQEIIDIGCDKLQGFYFSEAIHKTDADNLIKHTKIYSFGKD